MKKSIFLQSPIFAVINPIDNSFCTAYRTQKPANTEATIMIKEYKCEREVVYGTVADIMELTGASSNEVTKFL